jgi:hypothetical protein
LPMRFYYIRFQGRAALPRPAFNFSTFLNSLFKTFRQL